MDVISKAEFNSQRGIEEYVDADSDLVFDLDQDEAPSTAKLDHTRSSEQERGRVTEREGRGKSPAKGSPSPHTHQRRRNEKRARFYPVLNKQHSPSKVSGAIVCASTGISIFPLCSFLPSRKQSTVRIRLWRVTWDGLCPKMPLCLPLVPTLVLLQGKSTPPY